MKYYLPVLVYLSFAIIYQIIAKSMPSHTNPFAMLAAVYLAAAAACVVIALLTKGGEPIHKIISGIPWTALALGAAVVALEASMLYAYRFGWDVSVFPTVVYVCVMMALVFVGALLFNEKITLKKVIGLALCVGGLVVMRSK